ncbi:MAG TPA: glycosyltransferase [Solirubrobacterales bacterium]|nr:glycosyltransferase [Solirubrobacterales bacterium]
MPRDARSLKSLLPPRLFALLRRLRDLARRGRQTVHLKRPRARREAALQEVEALPSRPVISLAMPTYKSDLRYLRQAIDSVRAQHYPAWELCIVDDGSGRPELNAAIQRYADADARIKFAPAAENRGIAAATNAALAMCEGEFVGFLDHDDTLTSDALLRVAQALSADPELDVVYSDSDKLTAHGVRADPFLKPDWSPVYLLGAMYIGHLLVVRRSLAEAAGGFDSSFDTIQDFEFFLRVSERTERIHHIPQTLYHWRAIPGSIAAGTDQKDDVAELQARAVSEHLRRRGVDARAVPHPTIPHRAILAPSNGPASAMVSVVVAAGGGEGGLRRLLDSLFALTSYPDFEVIVVTRGEEEPAWLPDGATWLPGAPGAFRRGHANNLGTAAAGGEYLLFLDEDVEVIEPDWIERLVLHAALPGIGAVGPLLARPDGLVDQAGVAIGLRDPASPMLSGFPADGDGYYGSLPCAREVSALGAECLLVRRTDFEAEGGFNEFYGCQHEDHDLCQRLARRGLKSVYAPRPRLVNHRTPAGRRAATDAVDRALFVDCWYDELMRGDPYFNPGFAQQLADYVPVSWRERVYRATAPLGRR